MVSTTDQLGRVLADRYRLADLIGTGASSHVYAADDVALSRRVAVKILHPALASDQAFLRRFLVEAQSAASLNHPHVLRVFDWGESPGDGPFLVLEYLAGGSLREILDSGQIILPEQATSIGIQAAQALAYAHRHGIVHRDIKPANLLFDDEGSLRVADFGLARAFAESAWTEPAGVVLGTARYASPEQAEGRLVDDRSDVYSLALVLFEALTGWVPFAADTTVATLMARLGANLPIVPQLGAIGPILADAARPDSWRRLDAATLADRLEAAARELPPPAPVRRAEGSGPLLARGFAPPAPPLTEVRLSAPTEILPAAAVAAPLEVGGPPPARLIGPPAPPATQAAQPAPAGRAARRAQGQAAPAPRPLPPPAAKPPRARRRQTRTGPERPRGSSRRRLLVKAAVATFVVLVVAAAAVIGVQTYRNDVLYGHTTPRVTGLTLSAARTTAAHADMRIVVGSEQYSASVQAGKIISQSLRPGTHERGGTAIRVVESKGPQPVSVPSLTGDTSGEAVNALTKAHLGFHESAPQYSETVQSGHVIGWSPNGKSLLPGAVVTFFVSQGPRPRIVPSLGGHDYSQAAAALDSLRLVPVEQAAYSDTVTKGLVISTTPAGGASVARGTAVDVVISKGPEFVHVPDNLIGLSVQAATSELQAAGLVVAGTYGPGSLVITSYPGAGAVVKVGTAVTLYTI